MKCLFQLIPLVTAVSAVNVLLFAGSNRCGDASYFICTNISRFQCCNSMLPVIFQSVAIQAAPEGVNATLYGSEDTQCSFKTPARPGQTCLPGRWNSASWSPTTAVAEARSQEAECQEPDHFVHENGTIYDLAEVKMEDVLRMIPQ
ncbi:uncharacterized protein B0I36DRAFT_366998 [Microdochium trichocladiopsis]|uniref:Uncharacterized protein n=1 Tax=Microdochium trichocladiopsis TaxID=1682393 RepID=A0A9P9BLP8_9PEZI|nr:uncharacterized protein B0I36DRAFT_366998 [Microdochium trichocladiopsis]KAH7025104.1 hypothetical protein B0I36DRAFT_366998 [Microdochium trichocladiopsis]